MPRARAGAQLIQWPPDGTDAQIFLAVQSTPDTNPVYQFLPLTTLLTLGISNGSLDPGAAVVQWPPDSGPNQRFGLTPISRAKQPLTAEDLAPGTALHRAMLDYCPELRLHPMERVSRREGRRADGRAGILGERDRIAPRLVAQRLLTRRGGPANGALDALAGQIAPFSADWIGGAVSAGGTLTRGGCQ